MLECSIIYNGYSISVGREYIYLMSDIRGKKNEKYKILPQYKDTVKTEKRRIKETTNNNELQRYNDMFNILRHYTDF